MVTCFDIAMGNYLFSELAEAFDPEDPLAIFIGAVYYCARLEARRLEA